MPYGHNIAMRSVAWLIALLLPLQLIAAMPCPCVFSSGTCCTSDQSGTCFSSHDDCACGHRDQQRTNGAEMTRNGCQATGDCDCPPYCTCRTGVPVSPMPSPTTENSSIEISCSRCDVDAVATSEDRPTAPGFASRPTELYGLALCIDICRLTL